MKEKGILFKGQMVEAILGGYKTQTRRIVKVEEIDGTLSNAPYQIGDRLYVRETFGAIRIEYDWESGQADEIYDAPVGEVIEYIRQHGKTIRGQYSWVYKAEGNFDEHIQDRGFTWKPSLFMPKKAARIWLEVTNVRVERLQDISQEDALAEGIQKEELAWDLAYRELWESINGPGSWELNPWVWVYEFKVIEK